MFNGGFRFIIYFLLRYNTDGNNECLTANHKVIIVHPTLYSNQNVTLSPVIELCHTLRFV